MFHSFSEIEILDSFQQNYAFRFRLALFYFSCNLLSASRASLFDLPVFRFRTMPLWPRCPAFSSELTDPVIKKSVPPPLSLCISRVTLRIISNRNLSFLSYLFFFFPT